MSSFAKESTKNLLTFVKFTAADVVSSEKSHDTVDDQETIFVGGKVLAETFELLNLHLQIVGIL